MSQFNFKRFFSGRPDSKSSPRDGYGKFLPYDDIGPYSEFDDTSSRFVSLDPPTDQRFKIIFLHPNSIGAFGQNSTFRSTCIELGLPPEDMQITAPTTYDSVSPLPGISADILTEVVGNLGDTTLEARVREMVRLLVNNHISRVTAFVPGDLYDSENKSQILEFLSNESYVTHFCDSIVDLIIPDLDTTFRFLDLRLVDVVMNKLSLLPLVLLYVRALTRFHEYSKQQGLLNARKPFGVFIQAATPEISKEAEQLGCFLFTKRARVNIFVYDDTLRIR
jgi:hypothetical protein